MASWGMVRTRSRARRERLRMPRACARISVSHPSLPMESAPRGVSGRLARVPPQRRSALEIWAMPSG
eukprot:3232416-Pleurochrysis_carterae.AAC.1